LGQGSVYTAQMLYDPTQIYFILVVLHTNQE
jgi:hypothetical protein